MATSTSSVWLTATGRSRLFLIGVLLSLILMLSLQRIGAPLEVEGVAPHGIISFEFAGTVAKARAMIDAWSAVPNGWQLAALSLGLDYAFMLAYATALALGCLLLADKRRERASAFARWGRRLAAVQFVAASLDAVENVALLRLLWGATAEVWPTLAFGCAALKFALVGLGLLYVGAGLVLSFQSKS